MSSDDDKAAGGDHAPLEIARARAGLSAARLGTKFHYFFELDSTNRQARRLAEQGAREGEIVIAEQQTRGRGRLGRAWVSPPYVNLYLSVILRPKLAPAHAPQITLMAAVALADAIASCLPAPPEIKWPNDILSNGRKLAGILTESSCTSERLEFVILGIGVNLNFSMSSMPEEIRGRAGSLSDLRGASVDRESFIRRLIQDLDQCYGTLVESGFGAIAARWESYFALRNRRVRVDMTDQVLFGRAKGIDRDGALIVECDDGAARRIVAGDVIPLAD